jgi:hypothetical protein
MKILKAALTVIVLLSVYCCDEVNSLLDPYEAPVITELNRSQTRVAPGDTVLITVVAENPEEGLLYYEWSAPDGGRFVLPADGPSVEWLAPFNGGSFRIRVTVSNEEKSTEKEVSVEVLSAVDPIIEIISPREGTHFIQYGQIDVKAQVYHENGISQVWLLVDGVILDSAGTSATDLYSFEFTSGRSHLGPTSVEIAAEAAQIQVKGSAAVTVFIEGILPGKHGD